MPAIIDGKKKAQVQVGQKQVEKKTFDCFGIISCRSTNPQELIDALRFSGGIICFDNELIVGKHLQ